MGEEINEEGVMSDFVRKSLQEEVIVNNASAENPELAVQDGFERFVLTSRFFGLEYANKAIEACDNPIMKIPKDGRELSYGRENLGNDVNIINPRVSEKHALIYIDKNNRYMLETLSTSNGTAFHPETSPQIHLSDGVSPHPAKELTHALCFELGTIYKSDGGIQIPTLPGERFIFIKDFSKDEAFIMWIPRTLDPEILYKLRHDRDLAAKIVAHAIDNVEKAKKASTSNL